MRAGIRSHGRSILRDSVPDGMFKAKVTLTLPKLKGEREIEEKEKKRNDMNLFQGN